MKPGFSEFSYGYAITDELINWRGTKLKAAPVFPSLAQEGKDGFGYDLRLDRGGIPLFLQFKCPHHLEYNLDSTQEFRSRLFTTPFYRFDLRPTKYSKQHPSLIKLENEGNEVYYVAPVFHEVDELNDAYLCKQMANRSIFFRPSAIGPLPDDKTHCISYDETRKAYRLSEPVHVDSTPTAQVSSHLLVQVRERGRFALSGESLHQLASTLIRISHEMRTEEQGIEFDSVGNLLPLAQIAYLSRTFLDCAFLIISEDQPRNT